MNREPNNRPEEVVALRRFAYISKIEELLRQEVPLMRALQQVASDPPPDPEGGIGRFYSADTLEDWWYAYRDGGFAALQPRRRSDRGAPRRLDPKQQEWILREVRSHPNIDIRVLYRRWKKSDPSLPSISSIYRLLHQHGLSRKDRLRQAGVPSGPTKAFEAACPGDLWMVDFSPGPYLRIDRGKAYRTQLCLIVDDYSRLIPYAAYYWKADTFAFLATLKEAVLRRGIPYKLYTDNAKAFKGHHVGVVCANLGIRLLHAAPYRAWSKGKVERLHRTIQEDFEAGLRLPAQAAHSLEELNQKLAWWIQSHYHLRTHSTTGMSPDERYRQNIHLVRELGPGESIDKLFYTRLERTVRMDGTIRIDQALYEVDLALRGLRIEIGFDPYRCDRIEVSYRGQSFGLARPLNRTLNSQLSPGMSYEKNR